MNYYEFLYDAVKMQIVLNYYFSKRLGRDQIS